MSRIRKSGSTIGDVAALAEVSRATVSRVMNGAATVDPQIAERVRDAAARLSYRPSNLARSLSLGRTGTVAVSVPDLRNPMLHTLLQGITAAAREDGYHLLVSVADEDAADGPSHVLDARQRCDGIILVNPRGPQEQLREVLSHAAPAVVVNRDGAELPAPALSVDHTRGMTLLLDHLRDLGHRRLVYVSGPEGAVSEEPRRLALTQACVKNPELSVQEVTGGRDVLDGRRAAESVTQSGATAALVFNDLVAVGLLARLHELGVAVPGQLSVTGFDDVDLARCTYPALTTVGVSHAELGHQAWREMTRLLQNPTQQAPAPAQSHVFAPRIVLRDSTGAPPRPGG